MPTFQPPFLENLPRYLPSTPQRERGAARHMRPAPNGVTLLKVDGEWIERQTPTSTEVNAAEVVFLGGHVYWVDDDTAAELEGEGWTVNEHDPYPSDSRFPSERDYPGDG